MREITTHMVEGDSVNHQLSVTAVDEPGSGGANHAYWVDYDRVSIATVKFQKGPIVEKGINGVTHEALLAIILDRLEAFQNGPYANDENALALLAGKRMLFHLQERTRQRLLRGVEGTHVV